MNNEPVIKRLKKMLVAQLNLKRDPESIPDHEHLFREGLGLDSLDSLEIIVGIEREFKVKIERKKLKHPEAVFKTVSTLAAFIEKLTAQK